MDAEHPHDADCRFVREFLADPTRGAGPLLERLRIVPRILAALNARFGRRLDAHDLDDLAQDVFLLVLRKLGGYLGKGSLDGWVYRLCEFEMCNRVRKRRRDPALFAEVPTSAEPTTHESLGSGESVAIALQKLGGYEAEIIKLRIEEELDFEQIGARLKITAANAKTRYYRGLARLQPILEEQGTVAVRSGADDLDRDQGKKESRR